MNYIVNEESGQGMVEYGLIIVLIAVVVIGVVQLVGEHTFNMYNKVNGNIPH